MEPVDIACMWNRWTLLPYKTKERLPSFHDTMKAGRFASDNAHKNRSPTNANDKRDEMSAKNSTQCDSSWEKQFTSPYHRPLLRIAGRSFVACRVDKISNDLDFIFSPHRPRPPQQRTRSASRLVLHLPIRVITNLLIHPILILNIMLRFHSIARSLPQSARSIHRIDRVLRHRSRTIPINNIRLRFGLSQMQRNMSIFHLGLMAIERHSLRPHLLLVSRTSLCFLALHARRHCLEMLLGRIKRGRDTPEFEEAESLLVVSV